MYFNSRLFKNQQKNANYLVKKKKKKESTIISYCNFDFQGLAFPLILYSVILFSAPVSRQTASRSVHTCANRTLVRQAITSVLGTHDITTHETYTGRQSEHTIGKIDVDNNIITVAIDVAVKGSARIVIYNIDGTLVRIYVGHAYVRPSNGVCVCVFYNLYDLKNARALQSRCKSAARSPH